MQGFHVDNPASKNNKYNSHKHGSGPVFLLCFCSYGSGLQIWNSLGHFIMSARNIKQSLVKAKRNHNKHSKFPRRQTRQTLPKSSWKLSLQAPQYVLGRNKPPFIIILLYKIVVKSQQKPITFNSGHCKNGPLEEVIFREDKKIVSQVT